MFNKSAVIFNNKVYNHKGDQHFSFLPLHQKELVAIQMSRHPDLIFLIGYLYRNSIPFLLIDPNSPPDRIQFMLNDSNAAVQISDGLSLNYLTSNSDVLSDALQDVAYVIYTSGTTGVPKGVCITYDALNNFIDGISVEIGFSPGERIACFTTVSFDIFLLECLVPQIQGLSIVLANENEQRNPKLMAALIENNAVDILQMTPSRMNMLLSYDSELSCLKNVKKILLGGEPLPLNLLHILQNKTTARIYNMYGPTETTIWSTISEVTNKKQIDIGHAIKNTTVYIVDEDLSVVSPGNTGEICIAGKGLAKEYINRPELTAQKFISLPHNPAKRVYRTGDLGRYTSNNVLEFVGRIDNQVKINGYRIELEEIEALLIQYDGIDQAIVAPFQINETSQILISYYTGKRNIDFSQIISSLSKKIPKYMIPALFKHVVAFSQTPNGKIDRKKIASCNPISTASITPLNYELSPLQAKIRDVIFHNLDVNCSTIALSASFSSLGINSINFIKTIICLESEFDIEFDDDSLSLDSLPTIFSLIKYVEAKLL